MIRTKEYWQQYFDQVEESDGFFLCIDHQRRKFFIVDKNSLIDPQKYLNNESKFPYLAYEKYVN